MSRRSRKPKTQVRAPPELKWPTARDLMIALINLVMQCVANWISH